MRKHQASTTGTCANDTCGEAYHPGDWIVRISVGRFVHLDCVPDYYAHAVED